MREKHPMKSISTRIASEDSKQTIVKAGLQVQSYIDSWKRKVHVY